MLNDLLTTQNKIPPPPKTSIMPNEQAVGGRNGGGRENKKGWAKGGEEKKKNAISLFGDGSGKKVLVLLSATVERFGVYRMQDFLFENFMVPWKFSWGHLSNSGMVFLWGVENSMGP